MIYREAVAEARQLVKRSEQDQWRLAELTWEQVEAGKTRKQWAQDIGVHETTVGRWLRVWQLKIDSARATSDISYSEAWNQAIGRTDGDYGAAEVRKMPTERKAEIARELLEDERVADAVVENPEAYRAVDRAVNRAFSRTDTGKEITRRGKAHEANAEEQGPTPASPLGLLPLFLEHAAVLRDAAERITITGATEEALPMLKALGEHLTATGRVFVTAAAGATTKVTDEELEAWLSGDLK